MAKVTLDIEDIEGGKVRVTMTPTFEVLMMKLNMNGDLSSAEGYAIAAMNLIRKTSQDQQPKNRIVIPAIT